MIQPANMQTNEARVKIKGLGTFYQHVRDGKTILRRHGSITVRDAVSAIFIGSKVEVFTLGRKRPKVYSSLKEVPGCAS
jgi:hypothetical protein